jgi:hypothetical protein
MAARRALAAALASSAAIALAVTAATATAAPRATATMAPPGFFGVVPQAPLETSDFGRIGRLGLRVRLPVFWYAVEPRPGEYDFAELDRVFGEAADHGVEVLPQIGGTPPWLASDPSRPPLGGRALSAWRGFLGELVARYGAGGDFWRGREARRPVHRWQIWNEPNFRIFWSPHPSPKGYARLLRASAATIRAADPRALIVAAAVAPIERAIRPWEFLRRLYAVPGAREDFDVAALHPYSPSVFGLAYEVRRVRRVMAAAGDGRKPLLLTELGVASQAEFPNPMDRGRVGQAEFLERAFARLLSERRRWRIAGVYWFAWKDGTAPDPHCVFCEHAGLFDAAGDPKPAWRAMRRMVAAAGAGASASLAAR